MAGSFANYIENKILDHLFGCGVRNYTPPVNIFIALSTAAINEDGTGLAEPVGNGYARVSTSGASWSVAALGAVSNSAEIVSPEATGAWGMITHFALMDAATAGNVIAYGTLVVSKQVTSGDTLKFIAGDLDVTLD
mgnify:CR=1 FL=1